MLNSMHSDNQIAEFNAASLDEAVCFICSKRVSNKNDTRIYLNINTEKYPTNIIEELTQDALQVGIDVRSY